MELPPFDLPGLLGPTELLIDGIPVVLVVVAAATWLPFGVVSAVVPRTGEEAGVAGFYLAYCLARLASFLRSLSPKIRRCLSKDWFSAARCSTVPTAPNWSERRRSSAGTVVRISARTNRRPIHLTCAEPASESLA
jgi:hypothetical protein